MKTFLIAGAATLAATVALVPTAEASSSNCNRILQSNCEGASCTAQQKRYRDCVAAEQRRKNANPNVGQRSSRDTTGAGRTNSRVNNSDRSRGKPQR